MEKQTNSMSLLSLLPDGKVENDVRITDTAVTGVCTVYVDRTADEKEYILRTIGVAALEVNSLTEAVRIATDQAYGAAMSHIAGAAQSVIAQTQPTVKAPQAEVKPALQQKQERNELASPPVSASATVEETGTPQPPSVDLRTVVDFPEADASNQNGQNSPPAQQENGGGIEKIDFEDSLFPASDLTDTPADTENSGDDDAGDPEYQKALDMEITIFGKLNACNGWKAGKILNERPDMIVDFCNRNSESYDGPKYTGPRTDQKEALFTLYPNAVRKVDKAA